MARFHLNLFNDQDVLDEEGSEMPDLATAKTKAIAAARALMADHLKSGRLINLDHRLEIADENGKVLATIPFRETVSIKR